jgi:hypothetical protein
MTRPRNKKIRLLGLVSRLDQISSVTESCCTSCKSSNMQYIRPCRAHNAGKGS